jgi:hypothetical protein
MTRKKSDELMNMMLYIIQQIEEERTDNKLYQRAQNHLFRAYDSLNQISNIKEPKHV